MNLQELHMFQRPISTQSYKILNYRPDDWHVCILDGTKLNNRPYKFDVTYNDMSYNLRFIEIDSVIELL
jgi:hypothetical protein